MVALDLEKVKAASVMKPPSPIVDRTPVMTISHRENLVAEQSPL